MSEHRYELGTRVEHRKTDGLEFTVIEHGELGAYLLVEDNGDWLAAHDGSLLLVHKAQPGDLERAVSAYNAAGRCDNWQHDSKRSDLSNGEVADLVKAERERVVNELEQWWSTSPDDGTSLDEFIVKQRSKP